jgi:amidase
MAEELWRNSATQLAKLIREKQTTSRQVVESFLGRIEAVNTKVNAITVVLADSALEAADKADREEATTPLHGVPFTVKENIDCMGSATTNGVPAFADAMPTQDAPVVARMKAAGAIPLARTNLPELGLRISTDNPLRGRTLNPWTIDRTCGGSSGGEGSAIATGMSTIGLGNDIGGSLRNPAYCCGITSLKPTTGRIPHATTIAPIELGIAAQIMLTEGPLARNVEDIKLAYSILAGRDPRDPNSVDVPLWGNAVTHKRVALITEVPNVDMPTSHIKAIKEAGKALADAGWQVEEAQAPELARVSELWGYLLASDLQPNIDMLAMIISEKPTDMLRQLIEEYHPSKMPITVLHAERWRLSCLWSEFFAKYPMVIGPTWTNSPFEHDADLAADGSKVTTNTLGFITPGNFLGLPSTCLPTGIADGLPTGVQIYADKWREDICLEGAAIVEKALGRITPIDPTF